MDDVGRYTSIALDNLGNPHISYYDYTDWDLMYAHWQGGAFPDTGGWVYETLAHVGGGLPEGDADFVSSLKIFSDNTRHLCYLDHTGDYGKLMYLHYSLGPNWDAPVNIDPGTYDVGYDCSLDIANIGPNGMPAISYYDRTGGDLKIAHSYNLPLATLFLPFITLQP
jgi:hypothetical protein